MISQKVFRSGSLRPAALRTCSYLSVALLFFSLLFLVTAPAVKGAETSSSDSFARLTLKPGAEGNVRWPFDYLGLNWGNNSVGGEWGFGRFFGASTGLLFSEVPPLVIDGYTYEPVGPEFDSLFLIRIPLSTPGGWEAELVGGGGAGFRTFEAQPNGSTSPFSPIETIEIEPDLETRVYPCSAVFLRLRSGTFYLSGGWHNRRGWMAGLGLDF